MSHNFRKGNAGHNMKSSAKLVEPDIGATALGLELYRSMLRIRLFERRAESEYAAGNISGALHLSIGQEAIAAGVCAAMAPDDILTTTHRGHGHCLARGMSPAGMAAELLGRTTGVCAGKGGSMHMADVAGEFWALTASLRRNPAGVRGGFGICLSAVRPSGGRVLRGRSREHRRVLGVSEPGSRIRAAGGIRSREQRLRRGHSF